ncbi:MAG: hypothetical protein FJZ01_21275 [Candidatus Sericytochromatia bacterium]|nr:hypothetical protein [Candidatus Tanganyikabacteria bacterium]
MQFVKKTLPLALGLSVPVLALAGCPIPGLGTNPTPTPTSAATTPATTTRTTAVFTEVAIGTSSDAARTFKVMNLGSAAADLTKYAVSYEYKDSTGKKWVHARIVGPSDATVSVAAASEITVAQTVGCTSGYCLKLDQSGLGSSQGVTKLGLQATHGSLVLYKGISAAAELTSANLLDYVQYGDVKQYNNSDNWTHAQAAVDAKVWDSLTATASAPGADGKIGVTTAGATGASKWKKL